MTKGLEVCSADDWPSEFAALKAIDSALRCPICFEFINTAVMVSKCSHNFCSICIRRYLGFQTKCPACSTAALSQDLICNRVLDEIIDKFVATRSQLLSVVQSAVCEGLPPPADDPPPPTSLLHSAGYTSQPAVSELPTKASPIYSTSVTKSDTSAASAAAALSSAAGASPPVVTSSAVVAAALTSSPSVVTSSSLVVTSPPPVTGAGRAESSLAGEGESDREKNRVLCPVCSRSVPERTVNQHLDTCLSAPPSVEKPQTPKPRPSMLQPSGPRPVRMSAPPAKRKTLPKLVYTLLKDGQLKQRCRDLGLSASGDRQTLVKRHQEFTLLYNAGCDSLNPRPAAEVVKEVEKREKLLEKAKTQRNLIQGKLQLMKNSSEDDLQKVKKAYVNDHRNQFRDLIKEVRKRRQKKKASSSPSSSTVSPANSEDCFIVDNLKPNAESGGSDSKLSAESSNGPCPPPPTGAGSSVDREEERASFSLAFDLDSDFGPSPPGDEEKTSDKDERCSNSVSQTSTSSISNGKRTGVLVPDALDPYNVSTDVEQARDSDLEDPIDSDLEDPMDSDLDDDDDDFVIPSPRISVHRQRRKKRKSSGKPLDDVKTSLAGKTPSDVRIDEGRGSPCVNESPPSSPLLSPTQPPADSGVASGMVEGSSTRGTAGDLQKGTPLAVEAEADSWDSGNDVSKQSRRNRKRRADVVIELDNIVVGRTRASRRKERKLDD